MLRGECVLTYSPRNINFHIVHPMPLLALNHISLAIGKNPIVNDFNLSIHHGMTVAILGPSGSGKTSLLRLIAGLCAPTNGTIDLSGQCVSRQGRCLIPTELRKLSFSFQDPALFPHLNVEQNVLLGLHGDPRELSLRACSALEQVGLSSFSKRRAWDLSGGEAQRVCLARALLSTGTLSLFDEPFSNVDRLGRQSLIDQIGPLFRNGGRGCSIIVTHDPMDAYELADITVVMQSGTLVACGAFKEILAGAFGEWPSQFLKTGFAFR